MRYSLIKVKCAGESRAGSGCEFWAWFLDKFFPIRGCGTEYMQHEWKVCPKCGCHDQEYISFYCSICGKELESERDGYGSLRIKHPNRFGFDLCDDCYAADLKESKVKAQQAREENKAKLKAFVDDLMALSPDEKLDTILTMLAEGKRIL